MTGDLTWGGKSTTHYTDDVLWDCTLENYVIIKKRKYLYNVGKFRENTTVQLNVYFPGVLCV